MSSEHFSGKALAVKGLHQVYERSVLAVRIAKFGPIREPIRMLLFTMDQFINIINAGFRKLVRGNGTASLLTCSQRPTQLDLTYSGHNIIKDDCHKGFAVLKGSCHGILASL